MYIVVGLGNPGKDYEETRHNAGRLAMEFVEREYGLPLKFVYLDTYMNHSGEGLVKKVGRDESEKLVVVYDDLDLPIGSMKVSYNRGSGGHNGVESIERALGTREFIRIRIGISPTTLFGKLKKPKGEGAVNKFVLGKLRGSEKEKLKKVFAQVGEALKCLTEEGLEKTMTKFN